VTSCVATSAAICRFDGHYYYYYNLLSTPNTEHDAI